MSTTSTESSLVSFLLPVVYGLSLNCNLKFRRHLAIFIKDKFGS